jgi:hypothetical protein
MQTQTPPAWVPLSKERHTDLHWQPNPQGLLFAARQGAVVVNHQELPSLVGQLVLAAHRQAGHWQLLALLSLSPDHNHYVSPDGRWRAPYVPARLRAYPFGLLAGDQGQTIAAVDEASGLLGSGHILLDAQGNPGPETQSVLTFLNTLAKAEATTAQQCADLHHFGLLTPWQPASSLPAATPPPSETHTDLHALDTARLQQVNASALTRLRDSGALSLAYALTYNTPRLEWLIRAHQAQTQKPKKVDFDNLFEDDVLKF